jgi:hypothetical protein
MPMQDVGNSGVGQNKLLSYVCASLFVSITLSTGIFIGKKSYEAAIFYNYLESPFQKYTHTFDDEISMHYMRGGEFSNSSHSRKLATVHGNAIWGIIRNIEFWQDYRETNEDDEEKLATDLRSQITEKECFCGMRWDNQPGWYKGNCYHRPEKKSPVDGYTESAVKGHALPINIINPMQFGDYQTRQEERCALSGNDCGLETEKVEACNERDEFRCSRIEESYTDKYCIKCCRPNEMEMDEDEGYLKTTWDLLCDDDPENQLYATVSGGQNFPVKDLHVYDGGYEFMFVKWRDEVVGDPIGPENMDLVTCTWPWTSWPWPKSKEGLSDEEKVIYDKSMQGFHVKLWIIVQNTATQPRRGVSKCTVDPIWEVQKQGKPCQRQENDGCLYNEKYTFYYQQETSVVSWIIWIPLGLLFCGYCISAVVGYAGGWWGQWLDTGVGINWCPTWTK